MNPPYGFSTHPKFTCFLRFYNTCIFLIMYNLDESSFHFYYHQAPILTQWTSKKTNKPKVKIRKRSETFELYHNLAD